MKAFVLPFLVLVLLSCRKTEEPAPVVENPDLVGAQLLKSGTFMSDAHATSGQAKLYRRNDSTFLVLESFRTDNGPDLRVLVSPTGTYDQRAELGPLRSTSGTFSYFVGMEVTPTQLGHVVIWCEDFAVRFGYAPLN